MKLKGKKKIIPYLFISPWIVGFLVFTLFPLAFSLFMSLFDWKITGTREFIGIANYLKMFQDSNFYHSLGVTFKYAAMLVPINVGIAVSYTHLDVYKRQVPGPYQPHDPQDEDERQQNT